MNCLNWGIIGCDRLVAEDLVRSMHRCQQNHRLICAADSNLSKAVWFLDEFKIKTGRAYSDYAELLEDQDVDIVFISLSNDAHITWILKALEAGKHVLCEKPLALNAKQARLIVEKARVSGKFLMEAMSSRFFPAWLKIYDIIEKKQIGQLQVFHCNLGSGRSSNTTRDLTKGECPFMSLAIYPICLALYSFNDQRPIKIDVVSGSSGKDSDSWANITLHFSNTQHAILYYNSQCFSPTSAFLSFEFGQIQIPQLFWAMERFTTISGPLKGGKVQEMHFPLEDTTKYNFMNNGGLRYQLDHVFDRIRSGNTQSDIMSLESSVILAETLDAVRRQLGISFPQD